MFSRHKLFFLCLQYFFGECLVPKKKKIKRKVINKTPKILINDLFSKHGTFCLFGMFWQVNGIPLVGETHKEVVNILKELPRSVHLVCSRVVPPSIPESEEDDDNDVQLSLKELLAEFNDKVRAHGVGGIIKMY